MERSGIQVPAGSRCEKGLRKATPGFRFAPSRLRAFVPQPNLHQIIAKYLNIRGNICVISRLMINDGYVSLLIMNIGDVLRLIRRASDQGQPKDAPYLALRGWVTRYRYPTGHGHVRHAPTAPPSGHSASVGLPYLRSSPRDLGGIKSQPA
jgi:hypothetical protein